jgi:hypothetical protein
MFKFSVAGKSYQLPQTQYEISYSEGMQILELEKAYGGINSAYKLRVLEMLSGCDTLKDVVDEEIDAIFSGLPLFSGNTNIILSDVVKMNGSRYGLIDLNDITAQEYIDIERLLDAVEDLNLTSSSLAAIFYRPVESIRMSFLHRLINLRFRFIKSVFIKPVACSGYELTGYNLKYSDKRVDEVEKYFSYGNCLSCLAYYLHWKQALSKEYHQIFTQPDEKKEAPKKDVKKKENLSTRWGFEHQLGVLTEYDRIKMNDYADMNIKKVMKHLCYTKEVYLDKKNNQ